MEQARRGKEKQKTKQKNRHLRKSVDFELIQAELLCIETYK